MVSIDKTKGMVVGDVDEVDVAPLQMENGSIEMVNTFPYLESNIASNGEKASEVANLIATQSFQSIWTFEEVHLPKPQLVSVNKESCLSCCSHVCSALWSRDMDHQS